MEPFQYLLLAAIGLVTGFCSGMFGIGGGSISIPLLLLTGMELITAFGTSMFAILFSSCAGAYLQRRNIAWRIAKRFTLGAVIGISFATFLVGVISTRILAAIFFLAALLTVLGLYLDRISHRIYAVVRPTSFNLFAGGLLSNLVIGLRGGSGGTLFPPVLRAMHVEMHHAIATSLFAGGCSSLAALLLYYARGDILLFPAAVVAVAAVLGSLLGSRLSLHTGSKWLKAGMAAIVLALALIVVAKEFL